MTFPKTTRQRPPAAALRFVRKMQIMAKAVGRISIAILGCALACSSSRECTASISGAVSASVECTTHESLDFHMTQARYWLGDFPDAGPVRSVIAGITYPKLQLRTGLGDASTDGGYPRAFRPPNLRTLGDGFIDAPDGRSFVLRLPDADGGQALGDAEL